MDERGKFFCQSTNEKLEICCRHDRLYIGDSVGERFHQMDYEWGYQCSLQFFWSLFVLVILLLDTLNFHSLQFRFTVAINMVSTILF